jgi:2-hydroxychromene-2-carboxylate isomerase
MRRFIERVFSACWGIRHPMDPGDPVQVDTFLVAEGFDVTRIHELGKAPENKERLRLNTEEAVRRGVFGAPSFFVGDELYFGHDRLDYVERALGGGVQA